MTEGTRGVRLAGAVLACFLGISCLLTAGAGAQVGGRTAAQGPFVLEDGEDLNLTAGGVGRDWIVDRVQGVDAPLAAVAPAAQGLTLSPNQSAAGALRWQVKESFGSISKGFGVPLPAVVGGSTLDHPGNITSFAHLTFLGVFDKGLSGLRVQVSLECYPGNPDGTYPKPFWNVYPTTGTTFLSATLDLMQPDGILNNPGGLSIGQLLGQTRFLHFLAFASPVAAGTVLNFHIDDIRLVAAQGQIAARTAADGEFIIDNAEDLDLFADGVERQWLGNYIHPSGNVLSALPLGGSGLTPAGGQSPVGALLMTVPVSNLYLDGGFGVPLPSVPAYSTLGNPADLTSYQRFSFFACHEPTIAGQKFSVLLECYPQNGDSSFPTLVWNFTPAAGKTFQPVSIELAKPDTVLNNPQALSAAQLLARARYMSIQTFAQATVGTTSRLRLDDLRLGGPPAPGNAARGWQLYQ